MLEGILAEHSTQVSTCLKSSMMGAISLTSPWVEDSPWRRSILFPTRMTGMLEIPSEEIFGNQYEVMRSKEEEEGSMLKTMAMT